MLALGSLRGALAALCALALLLSSLVVGSVPALAAPPAAPGASTPLAVTASDASILAGGEGRIEVEGTNDAGPDQYNATVAVVLPIGVAYVPGSSQPGAPNAVGEPTISTFAPDPLQPNVTQQVLQWPNVADLPVGASLRVSFAIAADPAVYLVGSTFDVDAGVYANANERIVPTMEVPPNGPPTIQDATSSGTASGTVTIPAIELNKTEADAESEVYRGAANAAVYTLVARAAPEAGSTAVVVTDLVPAEYQVTACNLGALDCTRTIVTVGGEVFTRLTWNLGAVAAGTSVTLRYSAFIGLREITAPAGAATGAPTRPTDAGYGVTNTASLTGTYSGATAEGTSPTMTVTDDATVTVLDAGVVKSHASGPFIAGGTMPYTLSIRTSEYVTTSDLTVTDTIPDGMCPFIPAGVPVAGTIPADCPAVGAGTVTGAEMTGVTAHADGTFTVQFTVPDLAADQDATVTYSAFMRSALHDGTPTSAGSVFTNTVEMTATTTPAAGNTVDTGQASMTNDSSSRITTNGLSIAKTVWSNSSRTPITGVAGTIGTTCEDAPAGEYVATDGPNVQLGDLVCFRIAIDFPDGAATRDAILSDFLPPGTSMVSWATTPGSTATTVQRGSTTSWRLGDLDPATGAYFVQNGQTLTLDILTRVDSTPTTTYQVTGNLAKLRYTDANGRSVAVRDDVDLTIAPAAPLTLVKRANGQSSLQVKEGDVVPFTVAVTHGGTASAKNDYPLDTVEVWDVLPAGFGCADLSAITPTPSSCAVSSSAPTSGLTLVTWNLSGAALGADGLLQPGETVTATYSVTVPSPLSIGTVHTNTAAVTRYTAPTTDGIDPGSAAFHPTNPVGAYPATPKNAPEASDTATLRIPAATVAKQVVSTSLDAAGNSALTEATIGETVVYRYSVTIPARTSVFHAVLSDGLPAGALVQVGDPVLVAPAGITPATGCTESATDFQLCSDGRLLFPSTWTNTTASAVTFSVEITARVADIPANAQGTTVPNTATFVSSPTLSAATIDQGQASAQVTVVEPSPALVKTSSVSTVNAGQGYTYTLTASNAAGRPPLYEPVVVDCVPGALTIGTLPSGVTGPEAGTTVNGCPLGTQKLTWTLTGPLAGGATASVTYPVTVPADAVSGAAFVNTATITGTSVPGVATGERTYTVTTNRSVTVQRPTITKTSSTANVVPGQTVTWTISTVIPANVSMYNATFTDAIPTVFGNAAALESWQLSCTGGDTTWQNACVTGTVLTASPASTFGVTMGTIASATTARTLTLTLVTRLPASNTSATNTQVTNTGYFRWDYTAKTTPTTTAATFDDSVNASGATRIRQAAVTVAKSVSNTQPAQGQTFTYTVTASATAGSNNVTAYNVSVVDTVPAGIVVLVGGVPIADGGSTASGGVWNATARTLTWSIASLAPGTPATRTYDARLASASALSGAALTNSVRPTSWASLPSGGRTYGPGTAATASVTPQFPRINATKSQVSPPNPVYIGDSVTYRFVLTNAGGATAVSLDAVDTLPAGWSYVAGSAQVTVRSAAATQVEPSITGQTLRWSAIGGSTVNLAPGETITVTYSAEPGAGVAIGNSVAQTNTVTAANVTDATGGTSYNAGAGSYIGTSGSATARIHSADLQISKTANDDFVAGGSGTWTITVRNNGPDPAVGVTVTDATSVPAGVTLRGALNATGQGWTCGDPDGAGAFTCVRTNAAEALASGASWSLTVTADIDTDVAAGTTVTNTATTTARTADPDSTNNSADATATVTASADLTVTKTGSPSPVVAGTALTWTITLVNNGPSVSRGTSGTPIVLTDTLPTAFVSGSTVSATNGADCAISTGVLRCEVPHDLAVGESVVATVVGTVLSTVPGGSSIVNSATVTPVTPDPTPANDTGTSTTPTTVQESLTIDKTIIDPVGPIVPGQTMTYRLVVANGGPSVARGVYITDPLPTGLTFDAIVSGAWTADTSGPALRLDLTGTLAVGATSTVDVRVRIASSVTGTLLNTATAGSTWRANQDSSTASTGANPSADLSIVKSATPSAVIAGDPAGGSYTLTVRNEGPSDAAGTITITDPLPAGTGIRGALPVGCTADTAGASPLVTCTKADGLVAGGEWQVVIPVVVAADVTAGELSNTAVVGAPTPDPDPGNNTSTADIDILQRTTLAVTKTPDPATVRAGEDTTWTIVVTNEGPSDAQNVQVDDLVDSRLQVVSVDAPAGVTCTELAALHCTIGVLAAGDSVRIEVTTTVLSSVPDGSTIPNAATATSTTIDPVTGDPASATGEGEILVDAVSALTLVKSAMTPTVDAGGVATFEIEVGNDGPSDAAAAVVIEDTLPAGLTFLPPAATVGGPAEWSCTASAVTPSGQTVTCTLTDGGDPVTLGAGADAPALRLSATASPSLAAGPLTNIARATAPNSETAPSDDATVSVETHADLGIAKAHDPLATPVAGETFDWTITVTNHGPSDSVATDDDPIAVRDVLPEGITLADSPASGGIDTTCAVTGEQDGREVVECVRTSTLADGDDLGITLHVELASDLTGTVTNEASVTPGATPQTPDNTWPDTAQDEITLVQSADLGIAKTVDTTPVVAGSPITWTVTVTNAGPSVSHASVASPITVTDTIPTGVTAAAASGTGWDCETDGETITCVRTSDLPVGEAPALTVTGTVSSGLVGTDITNTVEVAPGLTPEPSGGLPNEASVTSTVTASADLAMAKAISQTIVAGSTGVYSLQVTNLGPSDAQSVRVTDTLPAGLAFDAVIVPDGGSTPWTCAPDAGDPQTVVCDLDGDLVAGAMSAFEMRVLAADALQGTLENTAVVSSITPDPDPSNNTASVSGTVAEESTLTITKDVAGTPAVNGTFDYTLTVGNDGPSVARSIVVTDPLPAQVTVVAVTAPAPWSCTTAAPDASGTQVTCLLDELVPGADPGQIVITVEASADAYPAVSNTATVDSPTSEPASSTVTSVIPPVSDLVVSKELVGGLPAGGTAEYRIRVSNEGLTEDPGPIEVVDELPSGLTGRSAEIVSGVGECAVATTRIVCTLESLDAGAAAVISIVVDVSADARGDIENRVTVVSPSFPGGGSGTAMGEVDTSGLPNTGGILGPFLPLAALVLLVGILAFWMSRRRVS